MTAQVRSLLCLAGLFLLLATGAGAIGSHALGGLDERALRAFATAVDFQFYHGLGLLAVTLAAERFGLGKLAWLAAWLMVAGVVLFCGGIYATTFGAPASVASLAPAGGIAFMAAWLAFALAVCLRRAVTP